MLTSQVPPSMASKRFFTSYPWSGSAFRSPSTPYLSDMISTKHTQYVCPVCIGLRRMSSEASQRYLAEAERWILIGHQHEGVAVDSIAPPEDTDDVVEQAAWVGAREENGK